ncbi:MAG: dephospho-CoA kinase [Clostridium sp.]
MWPGSWKNPDSPGLPDCVSLFGNGILQADGTLERKRFAEQIFENPEALKRVNALIHPLTWNEIKRQIRESSAELVVVEAALFDERSREVCRYPAACSTQDEIRIQRLMARPRVYQGKMHSYHAEPGRPETVFRIGGFCHR